MSKLFFVNIPYNCSDRELKEWVERSRKFVAGLKLPPSDPTTGPATTRSRVEVHGGSYVIAARRGSGGVLYSGPQLGFSFPELLYSADMARSLTSNSSPVVLAAMIYVVILWPLVRLVSRLERRVASL